MLFLYKKPIESENAIYSNKKVSKQKYEFILKLTLQQNS